MSSSNAIIYSSTRLSNHQMIIFLESLKRYPLLYTKPRFGGQHARLNRAHQLFLMFNQCELHFMDINTLNKKITAVRRMVDHKICQFQKYIHNGITEICRSVNCPWLDYAEFLDTSGNFALIKEKRLEMEVALLRQEEAEIDEYIDSIYPDCYPDFSVSMDESADVDVGDFEYPYAAVEVQKPAAAAVATNEDVVDADRYLSSYMEYARVRSASYTEAQKMQFVDLLQFAMNKIEMEKELVDYQNNVNIDMDHSYFQHDLH